MYAVDGTSDERQIAPGIDAFNRDHRWGLTFHMYEAGSAPSLTVSVLYGPIRPRRLRNLQVSFGMWGADQIDAFTVLLTPVSPLEAGEPETEPELAWMSCGRHARCPLALCECLHYLQVLFMCSKWPRSVTFVGLEGVPDSALPNADGDVQAQVREVVLARAEEDANDDRNPHIHKYYGERLEVLRKLAAEIKFMTLQEYVADRGAELAELEMSARAVVRSRYDDYHDDE